MNRFDLKPQFDLHDARILRLVRATVSGGPNFAFELCVERTTPEQRATLDLSSWDLAYCGAEPIRSKTLRRFSEAFQEGGFRWNSWYPCYGLAEATLIVTGGRKSCGPVIRGFAAEMLNNGKARESSDCERGTRALVACGSSLEDQDLLIVDPQTSPIVDKQKGHIASPLVRVAKRDR